MKVFSSRPLVPKEEVPDVEKVVEGGGGVKSSDLLKKNSDIVPCQSVDV